MCHSALSVHFKQAHQALALQAHDSNQVLLFTSSSILRQPHYKQNAQTAPGSGCQGFLPQFRS
jgi:hypothetical protein